MKRQDPNPGEKEYFYGISNDMQWAKNIRRRGVLKGIFVLVGLVLFTAQLSGKFYWSANMPVSAAIGHLLTQYRPDDHTIKGDPHATRLHLDKRYNLADSFGLPAPIICAAHYSTSVPALLALRVGDLHCGAAVLTLLRGPPSQCIWFMKIL